MTWAKVDDKLHSSVKWRRASKGARALWATALSWCSDQENDGRVPPDMLRTLDGTNAEAKSLVMAGLWDDHPEGGWEFHDWQDYNPDGASKRAKRDAESKGGKRGAHRRWHEKEGIKVPECEWCYPNDPPNGVPHGVPMGGGQWGANAPDPTRPPIAAAGVPSTDGTVPEMLDAAGLPPGDHNNFLQSLRDHNIKRPTGFIMKAYHDDTLKARIHEWRDEVEREAKAPRVITSNTTKAPRDDSGRAVYEPELCEHGGVKGSCPMCKRKGAS